MMKPEAVWDYLDGKSTYYPNAELNRIACGSLRTWNVEGWITDDILQQAHLQFWSYCQRGKLRRDVAPGTLFTAVVRSCLLKKHYKDTGRKRSVFFSDELPDSEGNLAQPEIDEVHWKDTADWVGRLADAELHGAERDRFLRVYIDGEDQSVLAEEAGVGQPAISMSLRKARAKIREALCQT
jgi:DNA-directed RNA polymerase specialized sigma24 family protein